MQFNIILISFLAIIINMLLSLTIPCLLKNNKQPFLVQVRTLYTTHKQLILTSSLIIGLTVYMALSAGPEIDNLWFNKVDNNDEQFNFINLSNLSNLNNNPKNIRDLLLNSSSDSSNLIFAEDTAISENNMINNNNLKMSIYEKLFNQLKL